jgi:hypothetical protein
MKALGAGSASRRDRMSTAEGNGQCLSFTSKRVVHDGSREVFRDESASHRWGIVGDEMAGGRCVGICSGRGPAAACKENLEAPVKADSFREIPRRTGC